MARNPDDPPINTLFTLGYLNHHDAEEVARIAAEHDAIVADIRFAARSWVPCWNKGSLRVALGDRYVHIPALGNPNYRNGGPMRLADLAEGTRQIADLLHRGPVILMCGCREVKGCHRRLAAEEIARQLGVSVRHLGAED